MNYENRVVVFIDILGFYAIVRNTLDTNGKDIPDKILALNEVLLLVRNVLDIDKPENQVSKSKKVTQFSDSIVISFLATEESEVFYTLLDILRLIINFVFRRIICRGGIAYGKLIHNDKVIFGPAMIQAYETESRAALYPRVILDESIIRIGMKYHGFHHAPEHERDSIMQIVTKDTDEMYYIDYFESAQEELDDPLYDMPTYIDRLRSIIEPNVSSEKPDIKAKYGWMRNKYNKMIAPFRNESLIKKLREDGEDGLADYCADLEEI